MMPLRLVLVLLLLSTAVSHAGESYKSNELGVVFPATLSGMELVRVTDYEKDSPGRGVRLSYLAKKEKADLYIYQADLDNIPNGVDSPLIQKVFQQLAEEILEVEKQGIYKDVKVIVPMEKIQIGEQPFLHAEVQFSHDDVPFVSHFYLTGLSNQLFKIRFAYVAADAGEGKKVLENMLKALGSALLPKPI